jgi:hypothetical protein
MIDNSNSNYSLIGYCFNVITHNCVVTDCRLQTTDIQVTNHLQVVYLVEIILKL